MRFSRHHLLQRFQVNAEYANEHQLVVIDCLDDEDETLRRKTLELLFRMTNSVNVTVIVDNMLKFLKTTNDAYLRRDLVSKITQLAERYTAIATVPVTISLLIDCVIAFLPILHGISRR